MRIEDIKLGMKLKLTHVQVEEGQDTPSSYLQYIGRTGIVKKIYDNNSIELDFAYISWYAEELELVEKKKFNKKDLIL